MKEKKPWKNLQIKGTSTWEFNVWSTVAEGRMEIHELRSYRKKLSHIPVTVGGHWRLETESTLSSSDPCNLVIWALY